MMMAHNQDSVSMSQQRLAEIRGYLRGSPPEPSKAWGLNTLTNDVICYFWVYWFPPADAMLRNLWHRVITSSSPRVHGQEKLSLFQYRMLQPPDLNIDSYLPFLIHPSKPLPGNSLVPAILSDNTKNTINCPPTLLY